MISYVAGYKYQLVEDYTVSTDIAGSDIADKYFSLSTVGILKIKRSYAWDGPSGGVDTPSFMRASLVHDVLCQMIAEKLLPSSRQKEADELLRKLCIEDGMSKLRAWWVYRAVRFHFRNGAMPQVNPVRTAP